jgi:hypothetical protein
MHGWTLLFCLNVKLKNRTQIKFLQYAINKMGKIFARGYGKQIKIEGLEKGEKYGWI